MLPVVVVPAYLQLPVAAYSISVEIDSADWGLQVLRQGEPELAEPQA